VLFQPRGTPLVGAALSVLAAIDFDDEPMSDRGKIANVGADRTLPPKLVSRQPAIPQRRP